MRPACATLPRDDGRPLAHPVRRTSRTRADLIIEGTLRPRTLDEYIGQREVKANLSVLLQAAKGRGEAADHVLLYGPPGLGKTTLATIIARELGVNVRYTTRAGDRAGRGPRRDPHLARRARRPVHRRDPPAQPRRRGDPLPGDGGFRARRDDRQGPISAIAPPQPQAVHARRGDDAGGENQLPAAGPVRGDLPARFLQEDDLTAIVERSARILDVEIEPAASRAIARRGRGTPRIVNRLLKRVRDHAQVHGDGRVDEATATAAMRQMEIDDEGLDSTDRKLLAAIVQKFASGPVGVAALAAVLSEEVETIEDVYEPFLLRLGFIDRTPQGRIATEPARAHLAGLGLRDPAAAPGGAGHARALGRAGGPRRRVTAAILGRRRPFEVTTPPPADGSTRARPGG